MSYQEQAMLYWKLLQQGRSPADAFAQAFPDGIQTEEEMLQEQAKEQQKNSLAQAGGVLVGALGARDLARAVAGEDSILGGLFSQSSPFAGTKIGDAVAYKFGPSAEAAVPDISSAFSGEFGGGGVGGGFGGGGDFGGGEVVAAPAEGGFSNFLGTAAPIAAVAYGANTAYDFARGKKLSALQKAAMALPTAGLSLVSDRLQDALGLNHKSTKEMQAERWGALMDAGVPNAEVAYAANHPDGDTGKWSSGKYAGQDWTFEKAADLAREDPTHFQHVLGNYQALGNEYSSLNDAQQKAFTSQALAEGLYNANKGDVLINNQDRAKSILAGILGQQPTMPAAVMPGTSQNLTPGSQVTDGLGRTGTLSPTLADQLGIKGPAANLPSQHQRGSLQDLAAQWGNVIPDSWEGDRRGNIPLSGVALPQMMTPQEMAIQKQFGSQLAAALAGR